MVAGVELKLGWHPGDAVTDELLEACAELFSNHYGVWSAAAPVEAGVRAGKHVRMTADTIRSSLIRENSLLATTHADGRLVAYATAVRDDLPGAEDAAVTTWVTQLVVHEAYRHRGVAKRLLAAMWGFSNQAAWGLVTANPYAVRALEKATTRRCEPKVIRVRAADLASFGEAHIPYIAGKTFTVNENESRVNTEFYVDHAGVPQMIKRVSKDEPWTLGELPEGEEWLAFTFRDQPTFELTREEFARRLADSDQLVSEAFSRMSLDKQHVWTRHTSHEVDVIISKGGLRPGQRLADFGCGVGRHLLEFARRGFHGAGFDSVGRFVTRAREDAETEGLEGVTFDVADVRTVTPDPRPDVILCLYDVIGSFANDEDNDKIIRNIAANLGEGGVVVVSVMNMELTEALAERRADVMNDPTALDLLPAASIMQDTGNVFDPAFYLVDPSSSLVYRREQFNADRGIPMELIVRDRRYRRDELIGKFEAAGFETLSCDFVRLGRWDAPLDGRDGRAKEILYVGRRRA